MVSNALTINLITKLVTRIGTDILYKSALCVTSVEYENSFLLHCIFPIQRIVSKQSVVS